MKNQRLTYIIFLLLFAQFICLPNIIWAQDSIRRSIFEDMSVCEMPVLTIRTDLPAFIENSTEEHKASLTIEGIEHQNWNIQIEIRGKYRRRVCSFPPITLNFKKSDLKSAHYLPYDKLKMITHCTDPEDGVVNVYKEFLAYELYNKITPNSFRAKIIQVQYIDVSGQMDTIKSWATILEPNKEMADRIGGTLVDKWNLTPDSLDAENYTTMALFQFMIGNHDWSLEMHRNIKCLYQPKIGKYLIIPYDFDFSGLVNPEYFILSPDLPLTHVKDRLYLGKFFEESIVDVAQTFLDKKDEIHAHCKAFTSLSSRDRREISSYLNDFYKVIKRNADKITENYRLDYLTY